MESEFDVAAEKLAFKEFMRLFQNQALWKLPFGLDLILYMCEGLIATPAEKRASCPRLFKAFLNAPEQYRLVEDFLARMRTHKIRKQCEEDAEEVHAEEIQAADAFRNLIFSLAKHPLNEERVAHAMFLYMREYLNLLDPSRRSMFLPSLKEFFNDEAQFHALEQLLLKLRCCDIVAQPSYAPGCWVRKSTLANPRPPRPPDWMDASQKEFFERAVQIRQAEDDNPVTTSRLIIYANQLHDMASRPNSRTLRSRTSPAGAANG